MSPREATIKKPIVCANGWENFKAMSGKIERSEVMRKFFAIYMCKSDCQGQEGVNWRPRNLLIVGKFVTELNWHPIFQGLLW